MECNNFEFKLDVFILSPLTPGLVNLPLSLIIIPIPDKSSNTVALLSTDFRIHFKVVDHTLSSTVHSHLRDFVQQIWVNS